MTNEQALKILEDATAAIQANRQTHSLIAQALQKIRESLPKEALKEAKKG